MKFKTLTILILFAILFAAPHAQAQTAAKVELKSYDVSLAMLEVPIKHTDAAGKTQTYATAYLVRLHGTFPARGAKLFELYLGSERIEEYGGLPDGLYFMVFDKASLDRLAGKEFGYRFDSDGVKKLGIKFEPGKFPATAPVPEKDAMKK